MLVVCCYLLFFMLNQTSLLLCFKSKHSFLCMISGKMEETTYAQTRAYLKPLLRMLKKQTLSDEIRDSLAKLVKETLQRNYIARYRH